MSTAVPNAVAVSDAPDPGDADLIERFVVARDHAAFTELVRRHSPVVLGVCRRVLHDGNDVDDAFQATFFVLVRDAARVRKRSSLASWLYGIAYRMAIRVARTKQQRRETILEDIAAVDDDVFFKLAKRHDQQVLDAELSTLPERYRQPLVLRYLVGKSPNEVANELGKTIGTVEGLLKRGKDEMRQRLMRRGVALGVQRGITIGTGLVAVQAMQQTVQAAMPGKLIESTIQASLAWDFSSKLPPVHLISIRAAELAGKEIIVMTAMTKTTLAIGLIIGSVVTGIGGVSLMSHSRGGHLEAAGFNTALPIARAAGEHVGLAVAAADPAQGTESEKTADPNQKQEQAMAALKANDVAKDAQIEKSIGKWDNKERTPRVRAIEKQLAKLTDANFTGNPLKDAVEILKEAHGIEILFDKRALDDEGISTEDEVSLVISGVSLRSTLRLLLEPKNLDWVIEHDNLVITTSTAAEKLFETRVYKLDLIPTISTPDLMKAIVESVDPGTWNQPRSPSKPANVKESDSTKPNGDQVKETNANDGVAIDSTLGTMRLVGNKLVIRQTQRVHEKIVELLQQLDDSKSNSQPNVKR